MRGSFRGPRTQELLDIASPGVPPHNFQPRLRLASENESSGGSIQVDPEENVRRESDEAGMKSFNVGVVMEARPGIPGWLWRVIAACLGIRLVPDERPIVATVFYTVGLLSGIGETIFCITLQFISLIAVETLLLFWIWRMYSRFF